MTPEHAKAFGAFYTGAAVAGFLVRWALRTPRDTVLDPSFGGGVFLEAATERLAALGGDGSRQVYGSELDGDVHAQVSHELTGVSPENLIQSDFFALEPRHLPPLDAVVGNPPFIRYQNYDGKLGAARAQAQGVKLTNLASSWAAFVVCSASFLKPGGRLGMVIPLELGHAAYARPVLNYLTKTFGRVTLLTFKERLFPDLSQDTLLLLADGKGEPFDGLYWRDVARLGDLERPLNTVLSGLERLSERNLTSGRDKLTLHFIPAKARDLYRELAAQPDVSRLDALAEVGIGYVTGANPFFHLTPERAAAAGLPADALKPAVFRSAALSGLTFSETDWSRAAGTGSAGYLLNVPGRPGSAELQKYLEQGEADGVHTAYKCRVRTPWYRVPHVYTPDAFLTYMSGLRPQLVANPIGAVAPNTLHVVRLKPHAALRAETLAAFWQTSLTGLSAELEGHALGGGMLKLEPSEARQVLVATPTSDFEGLEAELDGLLRVGKTDEAQSLADYTLLQDGLGLTSKECTTLRDAARTLRDRRYYRGKPRAVSGKTRASPPPPPAN